MLWKGKKMKNLAFKLNFPPIFPKKSPFFFKKFRIEVKKGLLVC